ncbi:hypothetical protein ACH5RR_022723 [Cinchona calisaya]|uniref:Uncharacterized protein n=1 Tax=Cinchona calisaya TaxID=153742 RepID=A0ABD2Z8K9_9GENT
MLRKKGEKIRYSYCKQYAGHNKMSCPLKAREKELEGAENQVEHADVVEQAIGVGSTIEGIVAQQIEGIARQQVEETTRQQVDKAPINQVEGGTNDVHVEGTKRKRKCGICMKYLGHTKANFPHA